MLTFSFAIVPSGCITATILVLGLRASIDVALPIALNVALSPYLPINLGAVLINTSNVVIAAEDRFQPIVHAYPPAVKVCDHLGTLGRCAKLTILDRLSLYNFVVSSIVLPSTGSNTSRLNVSNFAPNSICTSCRL